jgi:hypothetical protein
MGISKGFLLLSCSLLFFGLKAQLKDTQNSQSAISTLGQIVVDTDQSVYVSGDTIFFTSHVLTASGFLIRQKGLASLYLFNDAGKLMKSLLFRVEDGRGSGYIPVSKDMVPGSYTLSGQAGRFQMSKRNFYHRIYIAGEKEILPEAELLAYGPEGGHLVAGVINRVAFVTNVPASKVTLYNDLNQPLLVTQSNEQGTGLMEFIPKMHEQYYFSIGDRKEKVSLPLVVKSGVAITLSQSDSSRIVQIEFRSQAPDPSDEFFLNISSNGNTLYNISFKYIPPVYSFNLASLPSGIYQLQLMNNKGEMLVYRDFYWQSSQEHVNLQVTMKDSLYKRRDTVEAEIQLATSEGLPGEGFYSVCVRQSELSTPYEYLPPKRVNHAGRLDAKALVVFDHYLISTSQPEEVKPPGQPLENVVVKRGYLNSYKTNSTKGSGQLSIYLPISQKILHTSASGNGKIEVAIPDVTSEDYLFSLTRNSAGLIEVADITWEKDSVPDIKALYGNSTNPENKYHLFSARKKMIERSFGKITPAHGNELNSRPGEPFFVKADVTIQPKDYLIFPTMADFIKEVVPSLQFRKLKNSYFLIVELGAPMSPVGPPLLVINGVPTLDVEYFLSIKPEDVLTFQIINQPKKLSPLGLLGRNGIVIVTTKTAAQKPGNQKREWEAKVKPVLPISPVVTMTNYDPETPVFKSTIFWNPRLSVNPEGKSRFQFSLTDDIGKMEMIIQGFTKEGKFFRVSRFIHVVN